MLKPQCINHGCTSPVAKNGPRLRPVCSRCQKASWGGNSYRPGVTPFRTGKCANQNALLGFPCAINYRKAKWAVGMTEIDHIDGNHLNNVLSNVMELCPMCHKQKGKLNKDYVGFRYAKTQ